MESNKSSSKENKNTVKKSVFRYPEVPLTENTRIKNRVSINVPECSKSSDCPEKNKTRRSLHEPSVNNLNDFQKMLEELRTFSTNHVEDVDEVNKITADFMNRAVSSKLNFPQKQNVFKNLPKIEEESTKQTVKTTQKVQKKPEIGGKSKEEVLKMLNDMVEAEYRIDVDKKIKNISQVSTDEWLNVHKFNEPTYKLPNAKTETEIYSEQLRKDLYNCLFSSENYISTKVSFDPSKKPNNRKAKDCKCLSDFYSQHSMCS